MVERAGVVAGTGGARRGAAGDRRDHRSGRIAGDSSAVRCRTGITTRGCSPPISCGNGWRLMWERMAAAASAESPVSMASTMAVCRPTSISPAAFSGPVNMIDMRIGPPSDCHECMSVSSPVRRQSRAVEVQVRLDAGREGGIRSGASGKRCGHGSAGRHRCGRRRARTAGSLWSAIPECGVAQESFGDDTEQRVGALCRIGEGLGRQGYAVGEL